jgi:sigma-E factor negative regulatory protein RseC
MDSKDEVTHTGIVSSICDKGINVTIVVVAGCASCQIKGSCNMAEQADKELYIECDSNQFKTGQQVLVRLKTSQGMNALLLGYVIPLLIVIIALITLSALRLNEGVAGILSLATLAPYYLLLYLFKSTIKKKFTYFVNPLNT